ncbi:MAG: hypothetical protein KH135_00310 [Firmicutes bacterium]|nr:hypothetical protein [Bacillota bacterium]
MKDKKDNQVKRKGIIYNTIIFFNIIFIVGLIGYYGYRLVYFYGLEHKKPEEIKYLSQKITMEGNLVSEGDGLYLDEKSKTFYFKGAQVNNYLYYSGNLWRIMKVNQDGSMVLISNDTKTSIAYGQDANYETSSVRKYMNPTGENFTGLVYATLNKTTNYLKKTTVCLDKISDMKQITCKKTMKSDVVGLLNLNDYELSGGKKGYLNNGTSYYTSASSENNELYYVHMKGGIAKITDMVDTHNYGIRPTITLKAKLPYLAGDGTEANPYKIEPLEQAPTVFVGNYVKYNDYTWRVAGFTQDTLKLALNGTLQNNQGAYLRNYSTKDNSFNPKVYGSLANYLNTTWYRTLKDKSLIVDGIWYQGDYQFNGIYDYQNIYANSVTAKVGLLTIGDMYVGEIPNTWTMAKMNTGDGMVYTIQTGFKLYSDLVTEKREVRPAIQIKRQFQILSGTGSSTDPYVIGGM